MNLGTGRFYLSGESQSPKLPLFRPCPKTLATSAVTLVDEICAGLRFAYPAGKGKVMILFLHGSEEPPRETALRLERPIIASMLDQTQALTSRSHRLLKL